MHGSRLAAFSGRQLTGFALVRSAEDGGRFAGCPVVLDFDGIQAEICHWKLGEVSIGWDTTGTTGYGEGMCCCAAMNIRTAA